MEEKKRIFKFLWWKDYQDLKDSIIELEIDSADNFNKMHEIEKENIKLKNRISELETQDNSINLELENTRLSNKIDSKEKEIRKLKKLIFEQKIEHQNKLSEVNGRVGGQQAYINKLQKEIEELKNKKKQILPPDKPKRQVIGIQKRKISNSAKNELKKISELREN